METKNNTEWEKLCLRCGKCCHIKHQFGHIVIADPTKTCKYLKKNLCSIYDDRSQNPECIDMQEVLNIDFVLPASCPYTKLKTGYKGFEMPNKSILKDRLLLVAAVNAQEKIWGRKMTQLEIKKLIESELLIRVVFREISQEKVKD